MRSGSSYLYSSSPSALLLVDVVVERVAYLWRAWTIQPKPYLIRRSRSPSTLFRPPPCRPPTNPHKFNPEPFAPYRSLRQVDGKIVACVSSPWKSPSASLDAITSCTSSVWRSLSVWKSGSAGVRFAENWLCLKMSRQSSSQCKCIISTKHRPPTPFNYTRYHVLSLSLMLSLPLLIRWVVNDPTLPKIKCCIFFQTSKEGHIALIGALRPLVLKLRYGLFCHHENYYISTAKSVDASDSPRFREESRQSLSTRFAFDGKGFYHHSKYQVIHWEVERERSEDARVQFQFVRQTGIIVNSPHISLPQSSQQPRIKPDKKEREKWGCKNTITVCPADKV